jgi:hypothetical protein
MSRRTVAPATPPCVGPALGAGAALLGPAAGRSYSAVERVQKAPH